ncbi:MAG TPA: SpoIIE family protein phosphatase [Actinomycetota bacterium]|nr:SpoIIE family protein phosphatase [Actinomycetota bacterium]
MAERPIDEAGADAALEAFYGALADDDADELYDRAPCGYLSTTPDGTIIKVNQTFLTWTGYSRDELVGRTFAELLTAGGRIYHETHYAPMLQMQGTAREIALEVVKAGGERLPALVNSVLERDDQGAPLVVRTAVFDATERRRYEQELVLAKRRAEDSERRARSLVRTLQQTLIPPEPPEIPGLEVCAVYRPAGAGDEVGGDFYDVFEIGPQRWVVVVGDVRGKGVEAAVVTAFARYWVRAAAVRHAEPSQVFRVVNEVLMRHDTDRFCTAALLRLHRTQEGWQVVAASAGHPLPLLVKPGTRARAVGRPGLFLGSFADPVLHDQELLLEPGDVMVLYTDGVTEARRGDEFYGERRLRGAVEKEGIRLKDRVEGLLEEVVDFQSGSPRDDIVIVGVAVPWNHRPAGAKPP